MFIIFDPIEVEASFQALFSLLYTLGDESNVEDTAVVRAIVLALTADATNNARRRLTTLLQLLNLSCSATTKYELLIGMCSRIQLKTILCFYKLNFYPFRSHL